MPNKEIDVKWVSVTELKGHPKNPNKHPENQIKRLAQILRYQGFRSPIIVSNLSGFVTVGHGRIEAAKLNGWDKVPVSYQDYEDEAQEYAHIVSDNSIAEWATLDLAEINTEMLDLGPDFDIDLLGLQHFTIDPIDKYADKDADETPAPPKVAKSKLGDLWTLGSHRLLCGDSTDRATVERLMNGEKADMVFTDPPYGIKVQMNNPGTVNKGTIQGDQTTDCASASFKILHELNVPMVFFGANHFCFDAKLPNASCWITWDKQGGKHVDHADCELAWTNFKGPARIFKHIWDGFRRDSEVGQKRVHPTQKPVALIEEIFSFFKKQVGTNVVDLFGGSGSTLIACEKTNRRCFMMELDPIYIDVILTRWAEFTGLDPVREDGAKWSELNG